MRPVQCGQRLPVKRHGAPLPATLSGYVNRHGFTGLGHRLHRPAHTCQRGPAISDTRSERQLLWVRTAVPGRSLASTEQPGRPCKPAGKVSLGGRWVCVCFCSRQLILRAPRARSALGTAPRPSPRLPRRAAPGQAAGAARVFRGPLIAAHQVPLVKEKGLSTDTITGQDNTVSTVSRTAVRTRSAERTARPVPSVRAAAAAGLRGRGQGAGNLSEKNSR